MKTLEERANKFALEKHPYSPFREEYAKMYIEIATEQKEQDIKALSKIYADLLSAKGYDIGTINSELARLQKEIKEE